MLLDGWKELYLPVSQAARAALVAGYADRRGQHVDGRTEPYLDYVRIRRNGYVSVSFPVRESDSMEISCRAIT